MLKKNTRLLKTRYHTIIESRPENIYLFKVKNTNTIKRCEIYSKLTIKTLEWRHWRRSGVFIVNFEHISHLFLMFLLLTSKKYMSAGAVCESCICKSWCCHFKDHRAHCQALIIRLNKLCVLSNCSELKFSR